MYTVSGGEHIQNASNVLMWSGTVLMAVVLTASYDGIVQTEISDPVPIVTKYSTEPTINVSSKASYKNMSSEMSMFFEMTNNRSKVLTLNEELMFNLNKLSTISTLKDNWNGNGAVPFNEKLIEKISNLLFYLVVQPEIFPTANETIQLEYDGPNDSYLEFQINESAIAEVFCISKDGSEKEWIINSDVASLNGVINTFYGKHI